MKKLSLRRVFASSLAALMLLSLAACGGEKADSPEEDGPIKVTMGRQTTANPKFPSGDNYENNAYIRMAEAELGIDIVDEFEALGGEDYERQVSLILSGGGMPDMMKVSSKSEVTELYESGMIADLTDVYNQYASDYVKGTYDSFGGRALDYVTYDGRLMAIPATQPDSGTSMFWIRQDWADQLGLTIDADGDRCLTLDEVKDVAQAFLDGNPENAQNPVGMAFMPDLTGGTSDQTNSINAIAYSLGAYPRMWYYEGDKLVYGSTTPEMKQALALVKQWYDEGVIDHQLGTRTWDDITSLLTNGQCGIVFGSWHVADWLLNNVYSLNGDALFTPYAVVNAEGKVNCTHANAAGEFIVVNAQFEHPEIAIQILNLFYDKMDNDPAIFEKYPEVAKYKEDGVDGTARPFNIEVTGNTALLDEYALVLDALAGKISRDDLPSAECKINFDAIQSYEDGSTEVNAWSRAHSRGKGVDLLKYLTDNNLYNWISPVYPENTETMNARGGNLRTLEDETFIKIVTGAVDLDSGFETFVSSWNDLGGQTILGEVAEQFQ